MKKKIYISILTLVTATLLLCSCTFANNDMKAVDGIRNIVGGAENVVEDAGKGIVDGVRNITSHSENAMDNVTHDADNTMQNAGNTVAGSLTTDNNDYNATRTTTRSAVDAGEGTFLGMNGTMWTWLIMAIVGIAIVALVWMYAKQNNNSYND